MCLGSVVLSNTFPYVERADPPAYSGGAAAQDIKGMVRHLGEFAASLSLARVQSDSAKSYQLLGSHYRGSPVLAVLKLGGLCLDHGRTW